MNDAANNNETRESIPLISKDNDGRGAEEYSDEEEIEKEECEEKPLEEWQALMHLFKSFVGVGILGLPNGVMHGGILLGPIILLVLGLLCMHNLTLLTRTNKVVRERINVESLSYGELAEELLSLHKEWLGKLSKILVDILVCMLQLGFCCVYFVFLSVTMHKIVKSIDQRAWMAMFLPLVLAASFIRNVNKLSYLISVGNAILGIGLAIILQYLIMHIKSPTRLPIGASPQSILIAFGQFVYGFEGVALLPALEKRMRDKDAFFRVIKVTALVITVLYMAFGVFGYLAFGQETKPSITLNLPDEPLYNALHGIYVIIVYITYPVQFFAAVDILKPILEDRFEKSSLVAAEYGLRTVLVLLTFFLAITIPQLDNFMALIGSFAGSLIALVLPPVLHTLCYWNEGLTKWELYLNIVTFVIGVFGTITGTSTAVVAILERYGNKNVP